MVCESCDRPDDVYIVKGHSLCPRCLGLIAIDADARGRSVNRATIKRWLSINSVRAREEACKRYIALRSRDHLL